MNIREITSINECKMVFPVLQEVRTNLDEATYLERLGTAKEQGYTLLGAYDGDECIALMGYRIITDFVHGRHLYVDDLVVTESRKRQGLGRMFLEHAETIAKKENCPKLRLCTGIANEEGKEFYKKVGWELRAVAYKKHLNSNV